MKHTKSSDLRGQSIEELKALVDQERAALFATRRDLVFRKTTDASTLRVRRHNIARALTIIGEKEREASV